MNDELQKAGFTRSTSYELFMLGVSLLSFVNLVLTLLLPDTSQSYRVVFIVDFAIAALFFIDFITRLLASNDKSKYFFKNYGWADLLASVPLTFFNIFRIFRVVRLIHVMRKYGNRRILKILLSKLSDTALYGVLFLILLVIEFGSIGVLSAEQNAVNANIKTASDAIWWVYISITTVGYGDKYPVTNIGRMVGVLTVTVGVGLFGVVTAFIANKFLGSKSTE
jgi:voltage-gated potassium channel